MRPVNKMRVGGIGIGVAIFLILGLTVPTAIGFVPYVNENMRNLKSDATLLSTDPDAGDFNVTYTYITDDHADAKTKTIKDIGADVLTVGTAATTNGDWGDAAAETRILSVDLSAIQAVNPDYDSAHYVTIEFPEKANLLWESSANEYCLGFSLERNAVAPDGDVGTADTQDYKVEFGSGDGILYTTTFAGDKDSGSADSLDKGTCHARDDASDTNPEFGSKLDIIGVQEFLGAAYVDSTPKAPSHLYMKIYGPRAAVDNSTEELGDVFDVGAQFYTWDTGKMEYNGISNIFVGGGIIALIAAAFMTTVFNLGSGELLPHIHRKGGMR